MSLSPAVGPETAAESASAGRTRPQVEQPACTAIIVTYNSAADICGLLSSLTDTRLLTIIVVDNASTDDTVDRVRDFPEVVCVETGANLGYAGGINVGMARADPERPLLLLNPDVRISADAVRVLRSVLDETAAGVAVPMILDDTAVVYPSLRREPSLPRAFGDALFGSRLARRPGWLSEIVREPESYEHAQPIDWVTGAALMVRAECAAAVGQWDESFFLYSEETDFAARVRAAGWDLQYDPRARVVHSGGGSGHSPGLIALMAVNRVRYYERRHGRCASLLFRAVVVLHELLRSYDCDHRGAARTVLSRRRWRLLPAADPKVAIS